MPGTPQTRAETATVLFTDLVDSTGLRRTLGDDRADEVRRAHDRALSDAVAAHGGTEVKGTGDGVMAVFSAAGQAVSAAVVMQQGIDRYARRAGVSLEIRVGLSAGDIVWEGSDCFGTPVVEAARLCDAAAGGQILVSEIVRMLAGTRGGHVFSPVGALELKGLGQPLATHSVTWAAPSTVLPMPPALGGAESVDFVGRVQPREVLIAAWKESLGGARRVVLLSGEPGVGKTRMATEIAHAAHAEGCSVLFGRCDEELGVPYQPFVEALRHLFTGVPSADIGDHLGPYGGDLTRLVPELARLTPDLAEPLLADPETERYRLFEAVDGCLAASAELAPVVVVLDDIHWAAKPTLLLLRHLARSLQSCRLLIIATYRDTELGRGHPLAEVLADLRRETTVQRVDLPGLDGGEVEAFLEAVAGYALDEEGIELARLVHSETEGNPFFVGQVLRHLVESGALVQRDGRWTRGPAAERTGIPEGVREVIGRRLSRLSAETNQVLEVAAVIGRQFDDRLLIQASALDREAVLDALERGERARLIQPVTGSPGQHAFVHALVRSTLYEELPTTRRLRLHRRVGEALEERGGTESTRLPELTHHFCEAAALGESTKAIDYAIRAARAARDRLAYEEAAGLCEMALGALDPDDPGSAQGRAELLIELADARYAAGENEGSRHAAEAAAEVARKLGDATLLGRAAIARGGKRQWANAGVVERTLVDMLEEALRKLPDEDDALRAMVAARLASELYFEPGTGERRRQLADEAVAMARRLGHDEALAYALSCSAWANWSAANVPGRSELALEIVGLAEASGNRELEWSGLGWLHITMLDELRMDEASAVQARMGAIAEDLHQPAVMWWFNIISSMRALLAGRLEEGDRLSTEAVAMAGGFDSATPMQMYGVVQLNLCIARGGLENMVPLVATMADEFPAIPAWRAALSYVHAQLGRTEEAREQFEIVAADDFGHWPDDANWLPGIAVAAYACHYLDDRARAAVLYDLLTPYAHRGVLAGVPADCLGSGSRYLTLLAATLERWDLWERHLADSLTDHDRMGARPWYALDRFEEAAVRLRRGQPGDADRAREALLEALAEFRDMGMDRMAQKAEELLEPLQG